MSMSIDEPILDSVDDNQDPNTQFSRMLTAY